MPDLLGPSAAVALGLAAAAPAVLHTWAAPEATQGVAVDGAHVYAIGNSTIAKYDRRTGRKLAQWTGDPERFPHLNSCEVAGGELLCAASNYPHTPMESRIEVFDAERMQHLRTIDLGRQGGSLTWVTRKDGAWWAGFANYDGRGGEPGRDHRATKLVKFGPGWRAQATWSFPAAVLDRMKPYSASGGTWGRDGLLYVTGHDRPEIYVLQAPPGGGELRLVATLPAPMGGQAIAFDPGAPRVLFGVRRATREVVEMRLPPVKP
jgi:outer membrane protein assembly factor BamB